MNYLQRAGINIDSYSINILEKERIMFYPPKQNPRVITQSGSFFIYGHPSIVKFSQELKRLKNDNISHQYYTVITGLKVIPEEINNDKEISIVIPKEYKKYILQELDILNINQASLFPDLDNYGEYIKSRYK